MKAFLGTPIKLAYRNKYEGGLQGPCSAELIEPSVQPPELGTITDGVFTGITEGNGKIVAQFIYPDGTSNSHEVPVTVIKPLVKEVPVAPKITGGMILDIEE